MKQVILRLLENNDNIEILSVDTDGKEYFRYLEIREAIDLLHTYAEQREYKRRIKPLILNETIIGVSTNCVVINQLGCKKYVTFKDKVYNINFPNAVYIIDFKGTKIENIEAYCYKDYLEIETELFEYAMPNMLGSNRICLGSAPRSVEKQNYLEALERVIYTEYTHETFGGLSGFKSTELYFEYLENENFPYEYLIGLNKKLKNVI